ncbi:MAG: gamma-glutamylcyclotransferase (GGCT)/AIG2-like uncharacterized protein YtfP [Haloarculaceae archaeon]|jgi:gamma-glutamylcyclotransferase (GGCT)/AIG2-like uncharacterized protein YtfP
MEYFVYGTLIDPDSASSVLDAFTYRGPATLVGCHRVEGRYPTLAPGGEVAGRLLATDETAALDRYEGVSSGLYVRVSVPVDDADEPVETYVGDPDRLGAPATWPGDGLFERRVRAYLHDHDVFVRREGGFTPG